MKLITYAPKDAPTKEEVGILYTDDTVLSLRKMGFAFSSMNELIQCAAEREDGFLQEICAFQNNTPIKEAEIALRDVTLLSPIPRPLQDVICLGLNYEEHAKEASGYSRDAFSGGKEAAVYFSKRVTFSQGDGAPIPLHADLTDRLDYEAELALIIGREAKNVSPDEVKNHIFGYTVLNDVSARDLQTRHKQWLFGKSLDGFTPMGPCIVTADEIAYPPALSISCTVNGEVRQRANTNMLIHDIDEIVSELSQGMTLQPGTIIATGTPKGVAMGMQEPVFLKAGDVVACTIEGIGTLTNPVQA
ncbi:MAG: fumarylacetoacetate hydrolase family protein [Lachnospiraceae bacterium]|nr:fumarylacetoacetate hydrolase family protein [Lachnospiraceae bacterium]